MAVSDVSIVNYGLLEIGANIIAALDELSPNAIKVNAVYEMIRQDVLQARDWKFAVIRTQISKNATAPLYSYNFAYTLPQNFLRLKRWRAPQRWGLNPVAYPPGIWWHLLDNTGYPRPLIYDPPVYPSGWPYVVEALPDGTLCLMTDYDDSENPIYINYVSLVTDTTRYTPAFTKALHFAVAAAMAIPITESAQKLKDMTALYQAALNSAEAVNESLDWLENEAGSVAWESAGR